MRNREIVTLDICREIGFALMGNGKDAMTNEERKPVFICICNNSHCFVDYYRNCGVYHSKSIWESVLGVADAHPGNLSDELQRTQRLVR